MEGFIFQTLCTDVLVLLSILVYIFYRYSISTFNHWKKKGVPYFQPIPFFGNTRKTILMQMNLDVFLRNMYNQAASHRFFGFFDLRQPMLLVKDPELLKHIMVKDFNHFQDRGLPYNAEVEPLSANLVTLRGDEWKLIRMKISPAFSSGKLKHMFPLIVECGEELISYMNKNIETEGNVHNFKNIISRFSTNVVGSCAFGINCNSMSDKNSEFFQIVSRFVSPSFEYTLRRILRFFLPKFCDFFSIKDTPAELTNFFLKVTKETIEYREKHGIIRNDFMELLKQLKNQGFIKRDPTMNEKDQENNGFLQSEKSSSGQQDTSKNNNDIVLDNNCLSAQAFSFFLAGFETTAAGIIFCLYELAVNPDIQRKLRAEITSMLEETDGKFLYENTTNLNYLEKVVSETMRKYPTVGHMLRRVTKPYIIPNTDVRLEKNEYVVLSFYALHYDSAYFPDPEKFDPERFSKESIAKRHPYTYLPFGGGPRICIGMRFALLEIKIGIAMLVANFQFDVCSKTKIPPEMDTKTIFMSPKDGLWLKVSKLET